MGHLRNANVIVRLDCRFQDFAPLREGLFREILTTSHQHVEGIEHEVRFGRAEILEQIEVGSALVVERDQFTIDYRVIGQARQTSVDIFPFLRT